jgi:hypothetical protein
MTTIRKLVLGAIGGVFIGLVLAAVAAETVTVAWNPSPSAGIAGYRVYFGTNSGFYSYVTNAGLVLTQTVVLPRRGRWFFAATARDTNNIESAFSNEAEWEIKPDPPAIQSETCVRITPILERSTNLVSWSAVRAEATLFVATNAAEFFRPLRLTIEPVNLLK